MSNVKNNKNVKTYKKRMTNSGTGSRILAFFALLFSVAGCALEPLGKLLYSFIHGGKALGNMFSDGVTGYLGNSLFSISAFLVSVILFIGLLNSSKKMSLDNLFFILSIFSGISVMLYPVYEIVSHLMDRSFANSVGKDFTVTCRLVSFGLPALSGFLIVLSGLALAGKITDDYIEVEIPSRKDLVLNNIQNTNNVNSNVQNSVFASENTYTKISENAYPADKTVTSEADVQKSETGEENVTADLNEDNSVQASAEISPETPETPETPENKDEFSEEKSESDEIKEEKENLPEQKICKNCQSPLRQGAKFCSVCGTKYEEN